MVDRCGLVDLTSASQEAMSGAMSCLLYAMPRDLFKLPAAYGILTDLTQLRCYYAARCAFPSSLISKQVEKCSKCSNALRLFLTNRRLARQDS